MLLTALVACIQLPPDFKESQLLPVDIGRYHYMSLILSDEIVQGWNNNLHILMMMNRLYRIQKAVTDEEPKLKADHARTEDHRGQATQGKDSQTEETAAEEALKSRQKENVTIIKATYDNWLEWNEDAKESYAKLSGMMKKIMEENLMWTIYMEAREWQIKEVIGKHRHLELMDGGREWEFNPAEKWDSPN